MLLYFTAIIIVAGILLPYMWLIITSLSFKIDLLNVPLRWLPSRPNFDNYRELFSRETAIGQGMSSFLHALVNSMQVTFITTTICIFLGMFSAYAVSRLVFPGHKYYLLILMASQMMPPIAIVVPGYIILKYLHLLDTIFGLVLVYISFILPLVVWIMRGYFVTLPRELEDAARIDGCSRIGTLFRIVLPLSIPGLVSVGIFCFIASWNEYLYAFIYTSSRSNTLPVLIGGFTTKVGIEHIKMAGAGVLASLPPVLLALIFQKYLIKGLTEGAAKG